MKCTMAPIQHNVIFLPAPEAVHVWREIHLLVAIFRQFRIVLLFLKAAGQVKTKSGLI